MPLEILFSPSICGVQLSKLLRTIRLFNRSLRMTLLVMNFMNTPISIWLTYLLQPRIRAHFHSWHNCIVEGSRSLMRTTWPALYSRTQKLTCIWVRTMWFSACTQHCSNFEPNVFVATNLYFQTLPKGFVLLGCNFNFLANQDQSIKSFSTQKASKQTLSMLVQGYILHKSHDYCKKYLNWSVWIPYFWKISIKFWSL